MITSEYTIEVYSKTTGNYIRKVETFSHYKDARYFLKDNPLTDEDEFYRIMRTDFIQDLSDEYEFAEECVYEGDGTIPEEE